MYHITSEGYGEEQAYPGNFGKQCFTERCKAKDKR